VAITYFSYKSTRELNAKQAQLDAKQIELDKIERELERPYNEKQLAVYADAARVTANIATAGANIDPVIERRFWELYYGELPLFETTGSDSMAQLMTRFCTSAFPDNRNCSRREDVKEGSNAREDLAVSIANKASKEIKQNWKR